MNVNQENIETLRGKSGVYQFTNPTGSVYVGSAVCLLKRLRAHTAKSSNPHLRNSIAKHGFAAHIVAVLEFVDIEEVTKYAARKLILSAEQRWIDAGFAAHGDKMMNVSPTAGSPLGVKHTDATRQRMSAAMKESHSRSEIKARISVATKGAMNNPEVKARISVATKQALSPEAIAKRLTNGGAVCHKVHVEGHGVFRSVLAAFDSLGIHERGVAFRAHKAFRAALKKAGALTYTEPNGTSWHFSVV